VRQWLWLYRLGLRRDLSSGRKLHPRLEPPSKDHLLFDFRSYALQWLRFYTMLLCTGYDDANAQTRTETPVRAVRSAVCVEVYALYQALRRKIGTSFVGRP
jgi:hypothetical protein